MATGEWYHKLLDGLFVAVVRAREKQANLYMKLTLNPGSTKSPTRSAYHKIQNATMPSPYRRHAMIVCNMLEGECNFIVVAGTGWLLVCYVYCFKTAISEY